MIGINTNLGSLIVQSNLNKSTNALNTAIERMTTGFKINHAKDNAANYSISTSMSTKISAYQVAEDNAAMGLDMVLTASNSLSLMSDLTSRLHALAVQAHNGTYGQTSLDAINQEAQSIIDELYRIYETASYNGIRLFNDFSSTVPSFDDGSKLVPNEAGFLKDVVRRDTTAMDKLADVDPNSTLSGGTYSISTAEELIKLSEMSNSGKVTGACEFVLAADIDISEFCMSNLDSKGEGGWNPIDLKQSTFDGNGYTISGLYINRPRTNSQALFSMYGKVFNLGVIDPSITGNNSVGSISASGWITVNNCFVLGGNVKGVNIIGGIAAGLDGNNVTYSYTTCNVSGDTNVGGIAGGGKYSSVDYCYSTGNISGKNNIGGLIGSADANFSIGIENSAFYGTVSGERGIGIFAGYMHGTITDCMYNYNLNTDISYAGSVSAYTRITGITGINFGSKVDLQVGVNSSETSSLSFDAWFAIDGLSRLRNSRLEDANSLKYINSILDQINKKQTEYGAVQNRLTSVLDEISIKYDNLVSSRSTIRDANIAEESSEYIRNQILQQAAATLLATANQTPAIALQLL